MCPEMKQKKMRTYSAMYLCSKFVENRILFVHTNIHIIYIRIYGYVYIYNTIYCVNVSFISITAMLCTIYILNIVCIIVYRNVIARFVWLLLMPLNWI